jgi:hypothetical protein
MTCSKRAFPLQQTILPNNIASSDISTTPKLQLLETVITGQEGRFLARLAHVQLSKVLESLKIVIAAERKDAGSVEPPL